VVSFTGQSLYPKKRAPGTQWIGGWVGPRVVLDTVVKRKIPSPCQELNFDHPAHKHKIINENFIK
jgi:hypothetical protein